MKVAFCGPSGSGKTTLAEYIAQTFNLNYLRGSASLLMNEEDKKLLTSMGYEFSGHREVIQKCGDPNFAYTFENIVRQRRKELIQNNDNFVTDRSPVDNMTYFMLQAAYAMEQLTIVNFKQECERAMLDITHLIYIKCVNPDKIEDNKSRVNNIYYQRMVDSVFEHVLHEYFPDMFQFHGTKLLRLDVWDLDTRKDLVSNFLKG